LAVGRELSCHYDTSFHILWPAFNLCELRDIDFSESFKTAEHSFTGTAEQKSAVSVVRFASPTHIDFLPKEILSDFPQLNGIIIADCDTLKTVKNDLFTEDFGAIQYVDLGQNKIATIETNAFQHLTKLEWINLGGNKLRSLPHQIFKNNPELIAILLSGNKINSITPDFFKNLNKLQWVDFNGNKCTDQYFDCDSGSCSELNRGLTTCYANYRNEEITRKLKVQKDTIESLRNNLTLLIEAHDSELKSLKQELADLKTKLGKE
jgi:hypothetical protein